MANSKDSKLAYARLLRQQLKELGSSLRESEPDVPAPKNRLVYEAAEFTRPKTENKTNKTNKTNKINERELIKGISQLDYSDMALNVFDSIKHVRDAVKAPTDGEAGMKWMQLAISQLFEEADLSVEERFLRDEKRIISKSGFKRPGEMYMFNYEPLNRSKLKFYDTFPIIYLLKVENGALHGLNLHFLPPKLRYLFFLNLQQLRTGIGDEARLGKLDYDILASSNRYKYFRPCYRKYLIKRINSRMLKIPAEDWSIAVSLPLERFKKTSKYSVWTDSRRMITQRRGEIT
jgi:hypothetical protein